MARQLAILYFRQLTSASFREMMWGGVLSNIQALPNQNLRVFEELCIVGLVRAACKDLEVPMVIASHAGNLDAARNRQSGVESIDDIRFCGRQLLSHNSGNDP